MCDRERLPVFPSRASQLQMKTRLQNAQKGHSLLRKKSDALQLKYRQILKNHKELKDFSLGAMKKALFSLAEANFAGVEFSQLVFLEVNEARVKVKLNEENVAGVCLCILDLFNKPTDPSLVGLGRGGQQIANARLQFFTVLQIYVTIAQMETASSTLSDQIQHLNRRSNSLQFVIIPCIQRTLHYISSEMDEFEREEFYRLKKIQSNNRLSWLKRLRQPTAKSSEQSHSANETIPAGRLFCHSVSEDSGHFDTMLYDDEDIIF